MADWMVISEAREDFEVATGLADRMAHHSSRVPDWVRADLDTFRRWIGADGEPSSFTPWKKLNAVARKRRAVHKHGYRRERLGSGCAEVEKAIALTLYRKPQPDGLLLIRDADKMDRRQAYEVAVREARKRYPGFWVCIGIPRPELEAWLLNGFEPKNEEEEKRLNKQKQVLGCDPRVDSDTLKSGAEFVNGQPVLRNVKNIFKALIEEKDTERRAVCWKETDLETLRDRGKSSGLDAYLTELEAYVLHSWSR